MAFVIVIAMAMRASTPQKPKTETYTQEMLRDYRAIAQVAGETCSAPQSTGWAFGTSGSGSLSFSPTKLIARFAKLGVKIGGGADYQRWSGPLQKDVGSALVAHSNCEQTVFVAMLNKLPLIDQATGRKIAKPRKPAALYRTVKLSAQVAPAVGPLNSGSGQQIIASAPSTNYATGGPVANGGGPAIQNNYFGAPVTPDQKQQAHDALLLNLKELAAYPERGSVESGPSLVQSLFRFQAPRALYLLLAKYDRETIASAPNGAALNGYEKAYYNFEQQARGFEQVIYPHVGTLVKPKFPEAWQSYYAYALRRVAGLSAEQLNAAAGQLNFDITPEDEERVYLTLRSDPNFGPGMVYFGSAINQFTQAADDTLAPYR